MSALTTKEFRDFVKTTEVNAQEFRDFRKTTEANAHEFRDFRKITEANAQEFREEFRDFRKITEANIQEFGDFRKITEANIQEFRDFRKITEANTQEFRESIKSVLDAMHLGFEQARNERQRIEKKVDNVEGKMDSKFSRSFVILDGFVGNMTTMKDEFTILKAEVGKIKKVLKDKFHIKISLQGD